MKKPPNPVIMKYLSHKITQKRVQKNMSQDQLSERVDCHINTINNIECGRSYPTFETALRLSHVLEFSLDELVSQVIHELEV